MLVFFPSKSPNFANILGSNLSKWFWKKGFVCTTLMPYPCSHFYFDIKFVNKLYSKEKRRAWSLLFWLYSVTKIGIKFLPLHGPGMNLAFWCFLFCFSCGLQDFKFWYVNRKAFAASFLYWVDFTSHRKCLLTNYRQTTDEHLVQKVYVVCMLQIKIFWNDSDFWSYLVCRKHMLKYIQHLQYSPIMQVEQLVTGYKL